MSVNILVFDKSRAPAEPIRKRKKAFYQSCLEENEYYKRKEYGIITYEKH